MDIITKSIIISFAIVGLRIVSSKGMILHFLRKPFEFLVLQERPTSTTNILKAILKPLIGCVTCMASVYTILIDYYYFHYLNKWTFLIIFIVAFLNSILYALYERLENN